MTKATAFSLHLAARWAVVDRWLRITGERCCVGRTQQKRPRGTARGER